MILKWLKKIFVRRRISEEEMRKSIEKFAKDNGIPEKEVKKFYNEDQIKKE